MMEAERIEIELVDRAYSRERDIVIDYNKCVVCDIKPD